MSRPNRAISAAADWLALRLRQLWPQQQQQAASERLAARASREVKRRDIDPANGTTPRDGQVISRRGARAHCPGVRGARGRGRTRGAHREHHERHSTQHSARTQHTGHSHTGARETLTRGLGMSHMRSTAGIRDILVTKKRQLTYGAHTGKVSILRHGGCGDCRPQATCQSQSQPSTRVTQRGRAGPKLAPMCFSMRNIISDPLTLSSNQASASWSAGMISCK